MSFDAWFKRNIYWMNDARNGGHIRTMYNEIKQILDDKEYGQMIQDKKIYELLNWASQNTSYYKKYAGKKLEDFPVVNKVILTENHKSICVENEKMPWQKGEVFIQRTSGSTGVPFAVPQDSKKRERRIAELKYFNETVGFKSHEKLGQLRVWTKWHSKSKKQIFWENIIPINIGKLDDERMKELIDTVKAEKLFALRAYASWYDYLVEYIKSGKADIKDLKSLKICLSNSEGLNPVTREEMYRLTGIPIVEVYSDEEIGTLGQQRINDTKYYLNHADCKFEMLKLGSDEPAEFGELARIVITDLHNYAFPMIRYDTGDTAVFKEGDSDSNGWFYIEKLYGRRVDMVYDVNGDVVHPMNLGRTLKNFTTIRQWQFIQKGRSDYTIKLDVTNDSEIKSIVEELKNIFGTDANINVEKVDDIPVLASGKRKPVMCEWKKDRVKI